MFSCRLQNEIHGSGFKLSVDVFLMYLKHPNYQLFHYQEKIQVIARAPPCHAYALIIFCTNT